jgi:UDP-N-acetylglucosamine--N-acetylmuramyl-(pentapeptide) pyrophosphoryl-undecaprenol N-acetylglucosamine transferase
MKYLFTGGGTGGHVYPALAIADEMRRRQPEAEFVYVGLKDRLESWVVPGRGYPIRFVRSRPFPRSYSLIAYARFVWTLMWGILLGIGILLRFRPHVIVATGGFVSAPVMFAHGFLKKIGLSRAKVFIYEPNAYPGLLNQRVGRLADRVGLAFEQAGRWFDMRKVAVVGYPVRKEFLQLDRDAARQALGIGEKDTVVLVFGGSGGARVINEALIEALSYLRGRDGLVVLHITGRYSGADYDAVKDTETQLERLGLAGEQSWYRRFDYMDDIHQAYSAADLAVCRGGASTLTELCVSGLPALVVPLPTAAEDHQAINARELERLGAIQVIYQEAYWDDGRVHSRIFGQRLAQSILALLDQDAKRGKMSEVARAIPRRNSLELIVEEIQGLVEGRRGAALNLEFPLPPKGLPGDPNSLLRHVQQRLEEVGGSAELDPCELAYLRYQADRLLVSDLWYEVPLGRRNVGIKLVGMLDYRQHLPLILALLQDRTHANFARRFFGGDYRHGGFLRRNAVEFGIRLLGVANEEVQEVLLRVLALDPYFEVRAAAAQELGQLYEPDDRIEAALSAALDDPSTTVVCQAIRALGHIALHGQVLEKLRTFYLHENWQYRQEVVDTLMRLLERQVLAAPEIAQDVEQILSTAPYFEPNFPLADKLRLLAQRVCPDAPIPRSK